MGRYAVAQLDQIEELVDARCPFRPVRLHFGITSFGVNAWTARAAGDRLINEHDEQGVGDEELFLVLRGRAVFELDGERVDAPTGTFVFSPSGVRRTAFAEEAGTTVLALDGTRRARRTSLAAGSLESWSASETPGGSSGEGATSTPSGRGPTLTW